MERAKRAVGFNARVNAESRAYIRHGCTDLDIRVYSPSALFRIHFTRDNGIAALISERGKALTDCCYGSGGHFV